MLASSHSGRLSVIELVLAAIAIVWLPSAQGADQRANVSRPSATRTFADQLAEPRGLLIAPDGAMFVAEQRSGTIARIAPDGKVMRIAQGLQSPHDLALDTAGNLYVAETGAGRLSYTTPGDTIRDPVFDRKGNLYIAETLAGRIIVFTGNF